MKEFKKFELKTFFARGLRLTPIEFKDAIPFEVKRVYFFGPMESGAQSGHHCHKIEEEVFVLVSGAATAVIDRGNGLEEFRLTEPGDAVYAPNLVWHGFKDFSPDAMALALTSTNYNPDRSDYVEDYQEFLRLNGRSEPSSPSP